MKIAVIYARYSSDAQTEQSIEGQLRVCQDYASKNNIVIVDTYIDRAMTGTNDLRPDFQRMLRDSATGKWDYVLVYKLDRFSRNKYESITHKHTLKQHGISVVSATENIPDTPEGIILESLLEGMNQYYSAELSQKIKRGMRENRIKGNFQGGNILYGYKVENRKIIIDEERATIVRYIYHEFMLGNSIRRIIDALSEKGILYKGKRFAFNTVYGILRNEKYTGVYTHGDEIVDNMYPQIIDPETFAMVKSKIKHNTHGKRSVDVVYLLRSKMKCGYCGESLIAENGRAKSGKVHFYYKCRGKKNLRNGCNLRVFRKEDLETFVLNNMIDELSKPECVDEIVKGVLAIQKKQATENLVYESLLREKRQFEAAISNLLKAIEQGIITNSTSKRLRELEERQEKLERQLLIEASKKERTISAAEIRTFYRDALKLEAHKLIQYLIKEIIVFNDAIEIRYNSPLPTSPDDNRGFLFYKKIVQIPKFNTDFQRLDFINIRLTMAI